MANKIRSAVGGLAMLATTAFGQSVTNAPVILTPQKVNYSTRDKITISASNFNNGVSFNLYKSTNLVDWVKGALVYSGSDPTSLVSKAYFESTSAFRDKAFYLLSTSNVPSFKKD